LQGTTTHLEDSCYLHDLKIENIFLKLRDQWWISLSLYRTVHIYKLEMRGPVSITWCHRAGFFVWITKESFALDSFQFINYSSSKISFHIKVISLLQSIKEVVFLLCWKSWDLCSGHFLFFHLTNTIINLQKWYQEFKILKRWWWNPPAVCILLLLDHGNAQCKWECLEVKKKLIT
jgi:hypothetical protein